MNFNNINYLYRKFKVKQLLFIKVGVGVGGWSMGRLRKISSPSYIFLPQLRSDFFQIILKVLISLKSDNPFLLIINFSIIKFISTRKTVSFIRKSFLTPREKIKIWDKSGPFPGFFGVASAESSFKNWCKCLNSNLCTSKYTNKP